MKKQIALLLTVAMVLTGLTGCGSNSGKAQTSGATDSGTEAGNAEQAGGDSKEQTAKEDQPKDVIVLKWGDAAVDGTAEYEANQKFIELVETYTDGRVKIEYYPAGQLGSDGDVVQACMANTLEMAKCSTANLSEFCHVLDFCDFPGMFRDTDHVYQVLASDLRDELAAQVDEEIGCYPVTFDVDGGAARWLFNTKREVKVPEDAFNLKVRTTGSEIEMALYQACGIGATPMAWQELYTGLEQGTVDGVYAGPVPAFTNNFTEVAKYATVMTLSFGPSVRVISSGAVDALGGVDGELFQAVIKASRESEQIKRELNEKDVAGVADKMREQGVAVYEPTAEEQEKWLEAAGEIVPTFIGDGKTISKELYDQVQAIGK